MPQISYVISCDSNFRPIMAAECVVKKMPATLEDIKVGVEIAKLAAGIPPLNFDLHNGTH